VQTTVGELKDATSPLIPSGYINGGVELIDRLFKREFKMEEVPDILPKRRMPAGAVPLPKSESSSSNESGVTPIKKAKYGETPEPVSYQLASQIVSCFTFANR
jgi:hypothetical protein